MSTSIPSSLVDVCFTSVLLSFGLCEGGSPRKTDVMSGLLFASVDHRWETFVNICGRIFLLSQWSRQLLLEFGG